MTEPFPLNAAVTAANPNNFMAEKKTIEQRVKEIVEEQLGCAPELITPEAKFDADLGADSLDAVELVLALEEEFGCEISDETAEKLVTVADAVKYIEENYRP